MTTIERWDGLPERTVFPGFHGRFIHSGQMTFARWRIDAGATLLMAPADAFYGERSGVIVDPFGHRWNIGHSIEDVSPEDMQRRYSAMTAPPGTG